MKFEPLISERADRVIHINGQNLVNVLRQSHIEAVTGQDIDISNERVPCGSEVRQQLDPLGHPIKNLLLPDRTKNIAREIIEIGGNDRFPGIDREVQRRARFSNVANTLEEIARPLVFFEESEGVLLGGGSVIPVNSIVSLNGDTGGDDGLSVTEGDDIGWLR